MRYNLEVNNTTLFLVPPLGVSKMILKEHGFLGAYLGDVNKKEIVYERGVFMLFRPPNMVFFNEWLEEEKLRTEHLVEDYDYPDGYVVVVYVLEEEFADDYKKFLKGEYSKFSQAFKSRFTKTVRVGNIGRGKEEITWQWRIFKKDPEIRKNWEEELGVVIPEDMEVWSSPTLKEGYELLNISLIRGVKYLASSQTDEL